MPVQLNRLWCLALREGGRPIPRWQQATREWREGLLRIQEEKDALTGRTMLVARLHHADRGNEVRQPLLDARIVQMNDDRMVLTGIERDELHRVDVAQAWLLLKGREAPAGAGSHSAR